jgi:hypothetical protein
MREISSHRHELRRRSGAVKRSSAPNEPTTSGRRWDRASPTDSWHRSAQQPPLRQPVPFWSDVADAHVIGSITLRGRPAWHVTFFDPETPAWFAAVLDKQTLRTLDLRMVTTAHFMHHVYGGFNQQQRLEPPTAR